MWLQLRRGRYRRADDQPRRSLGLSWLVIPAATLGGTIAGFGPGWLAVPAWVYLIGASAVAWIDIDVHRVPDRLLLLWVPAVLAALLVAAAMTSWSILLWSAAGAISLGLLFLVLALVGSMGLGDVKLAATTGLVVGLFGWPGLVTAVVVAFVAAAVVAVVLLIRGVSRHSHLAFGPAIIVGAAVAVLRAGLGL